MRFRQHERTARQSTLRLLALFGLVLVGLLLAVNGALALAYRLTVPFADGYPTLFFETNTALVLLFVLGGCWIESLRLREGGAHVARMAGGRPAQLSAGGELGLLERRLAHVVQEMAIAAGPAARVGADAADDPGARRALPAVWVLPKDDAINAFAAGWQADDAVIAVTRGALERLTRAELQGVVAHEFSHLVHGDTRLNMRLLGLVWGLQMVWGLGVSLWEPDSTGRRGAGALFGLGLMAVGSLGWAAGRMLQAAVSRQREYLADATAVKYTRAVDGLGGALRKIADQQLHGRAALGSPHAASLAHLLLAERGAGGGWQALWHTHPPLHERLRRLYGRAVEPLAAPVIPLGEGDVEARVGLVPSPAVGRATSGDGNAAGEGSRHAAATAEGIEAERHDALQRPASFDAAAREQEALARIALWHGPGEWQAAMLALAVSGEAADAASTTGAARTTTAGGAAGAAIAWDAWATACADLGVAAAVRREIEALSPPARRQVFETLIARARSASPVRQRAMQQALRARWARLPPSPSRRWRALAIALLLPSGSRRACGPVTRRSLADSNTAAHAATAALSQVLGLPEARAEAWRRAASAALVELGAPPPRGPAAGLAPPALQPGLGLALRVRRLAPMQRPLLLRAWLRASETGGVHGRADVGDALHLACLVLDLPVPESLATAAADAPMAARQRPLDAAAH